MKKTQETRLKWYGQVMRSDRESDEKRTLDMEVQARRRGRPKTRWEDCIAVDMREKGLNTNMTSDRCRWKRLTKNSDQIVERRVNKGDQEEKGIEWWYSSSHLPSKGYSILLTDRIQVAAHKLEMLITGLKCSSIQ